MVSRPGASSRISNPVFQSDYPAYEKEDAISFLDLIELNIGGKLRDAGVPLPYLRKVYNHLRQEYGDHPFCRRAIYVANRKIFTTGLSQDEGHSVIEAITKQAYFDRKILPFLEKIDYDRTTEQAIRWHIANRVVIDPKIHFGQPIVEGVGIATSVLRDSSYANDRNAAFVAKWFGIGKEHVLAAVAFEEELAA